MVNGFSKLDSGSVAIMAECAKGGAAKQVVQTMKERDKQMLLDADRAHQDAKMAKRLEARAKEEKVIYNKCQKKWGSWPRKSSQSP